MQCHQQFTLGDHCKLSSHDPHPIDTHIIKLSSTQYHKHSLQTLHSHPLIEFVGSYKSLRSRCCNFGQILSTTSENQARSWRICIHIISLSTVFLSLLLSSMTLTEILCLLCSCFKRSVNERSNREFHFRFSFQEHFIQQVTPSFLVGTLVLLSALTPTLQKTILNPIDHSFTIPIFTCSKSEISK
jgi:hypothetical protein